MRIRFPSVLAKSYLRSESIEAKMQFFSVNQLMQKEILPQILGLDNAGTSKIKKRTEALLRPLCLLAMAKIATSAVACC